MPLAGTRVLDQDLDLGGRRVFNPGAPALPTDVVRLEDIAGLSADPEGWYVVVKSAHAPANSVNLGALGSGFVISTVTAGVAALTIDTSTYLTTTLAASTYLAITAAASTYQPKLTSASGANLTGKFVLEGTADAGAPNAQFLGALTTGVVKNTTTTGVLSIAAANVDFADPGAFYVVVKSASAPGSAVNLGALGSGFVKSAVSAGVATLSIDASTYLTTAAAASTYQPLLTAATGANLTPTFIVQTAASGLPNAQALSAIATGLVKVTTTTGVLSAAASNTDFADPGAFYVVTRSTNAPGNAINLGALTAGVLQQTVAGSVATVTALNIANRLVPFGSGTGFLATNALFQVHVDTPGVSLSIANGTGTILLGGGGVSVSQTSSTLSGTIGFVNDRAGPPGGAQIYYTGSTSTDPAGVNTLVIGNTAFATIGAGGAVGDVVFSSGTFAGNGLLLNLKPDGGVLIYNSSAAVSIAGTSGLRSNAGKLQYSESGGAWANFTDLVGAPAAAFYVVTKSAGAPTNAVNLGGLTTGLVKSTVSAGVSTLSIDATAYLSGSVGPGAGTYGGGGSFVQSVTLDINGRVTAVATGAPPASGADALGTYVVTSSTHAPASAVNLGGLGSGFVKSSVTSGVSTLSIDTSSYLSAAYVTVAAAGTARTQRGTLNFGAAFTAVDNAGAARTDVDLAATLGGVTTVTNANLTIGADGRVTAASSGSGGGTGADALGFYVVLQASHAPANATNLGALTTGLLSIAVSGGIATVGNGSAYMNVQQAGTPVTQRSVLNFTAQLSASDVLGKTQVDLAASGVGAGTYSYPTMVVDIYGRVVSISSNAAPQPALSLTAGDVLYATGTTTVGQDANFAYNATTHALTLGGFLSVNGSNGDSVGSAILLGKASDQGITKTGGALWIGTKDAHALEFITNNASIGGIDTSGVLSIGARIEAGTFTGPSLGAVNIGGSGIIQSNGGGSVLALQNAASPGTVISLNGSNIDVTGTLLPHTHVTYDLGSSSHYWNNGYVAVVNTTQVNGVSNLTFDTLFSGDVIHKTATVESFRVRGADQVIKFVANNITPVVGTVDYTSWGTAVSSDIMVARSWLKTMDATGATCYVQLWTVSS